MCTITIIVASIMGDTNVKQVHLYQEKKTFPHYDAAAVMNAAVFKMLICRNEMHYSEPSAYCSQQRCITATLCLYSSILYARNTGG